MATAENAARTCPSCSALFSPTARICPICKLEVAKMDAFAAAKRAAAQRGYRSTAVETEGTPIYRRLLHPAVIFPLILVLIVILYFAKPKPAPAWTRMPDTPIDAAKALLADVAADNNKAFSHAYSLVAPAARNAEDSDEEGHYLQLFLTMNKYLSTEFGADWNTRTTLEADKADPTFIVAHIGLETLHIRTTLVTPPELVNDSNRHYGVMGINEFDIADAAGLQQAGIASGLLRAYGATGSITQLDSLKASLGGRARETPMQTKLRVLPNLRNPRAATRMAVLQTWPIRTDPVMRNRLEQISTDDRYDQEVKQTAVDVLKENVALEELIAAHVNTN